MNHRVRFALANEGMQVASAIGDGRFTAETDGDARENGRLARSIVADN